jgi:hypothetical protein
VKSIAQEPVRDDLLKIMVARYGEATVSMPFPGAGDMDVLSRNVSISSLRDNKLEIVLSPLTVEWFISRKYNYRIFENEGNKGIITAGTTKQAMEWDSYPTYVQYDSIMQSFAALYPQICHLDTIGATNYGKIVLVLKISDNPLTDEDEPETFYSSSIHGDETGGFILMLRLADYLLKHYNIDSRIRNLVDNLEIWINPLANPDGAYKTGNTISSPIRFNANGYDLNRNFPDPVSDNPNKQMETLDMMKFMRSHNFVLSANFHSGEEVVNYPWDRWEIRHPDDEWFHYISRKYADTVHIHSAAGYMTFLENGVTNGWDWYSVYGGRQDYVTWELHGREVTIELDDNYITPVSQLGSLWEANYRSLIGYLENALYGIRGIVADNITGEAVPAKVSVDAHDAYNSHILCDTLTGGFIRLISPGTWPLRFTADGYLTKVLNVIVANEQMTRVNVKMEPIVNPIDTVTTAGLFIYPNPANEFIKVVLPDRQIGIVEVMIFNSLGMKVRMNSVNSKVHTTEDIPLYINVQDLPGGIYTIIIRNTTTKVTDKASFVKVHRK